MSDFCHDWEPGGFGCVVPMHDNGGKCPSDCLGDFTYDARRKIKELEPDEEIALGMCEGHGAVLVLGRTEEGFYVRHAVIEGWEDRADANDELIGETPWVPAGDRDFGEQSQSDPRTGRSLTRRCDGPIAIGGTRGGGTGRDQA